MCHALLVELEPLTGGVRATTPCESQSRRQDAQGKHTIDPRPCERRRSGIGKKLRFPHTWLRRDSTSIRRACLSNSGRRLYWTSPLSDRGPLYRTTHWVPWRLPIIRHSEAKMAASARSPSCTQHIVSQCDWSHHTPVSGTSRMLDQWDSALKGNSAIKAHIARAAASNLHMCGYPPETLVLGTFTHKSQRCLEVWSGQSHQGAAPPAYSLDGCGVARGPKDCYRKSGSRSPLAGGCGTKRRSWVSSYPASRFCSESTCRLSG